MATKKVKVAALLLDYNLYPRHRIDSTHVAGMVRALAAGELFPPIVADRTSRRVIDGFHRIEAIKRFSGEEAEIDVEWHSYETEADMLEDAIRLNARHGNRLNPWDRARSVLLAEEMGLSIDRTAVALAMTVEAVGEFKLRKLAIAPDAKLLPIKGTIAYLAGKHLNSLQVQGNERAGGMRPLFYINQVMNLVNYSLIDESDERLMAALKALHRVLSEYLVAIPI